MKGTALTGVLLLGVLGGCQERGAPEPPPPNLGGARIEISQVDLTTRSGSILSATRDNNGQWQVNFLGSGPPRDIQKVLSAEEGQRLDALLLDRQLFAPASPSRTTCQGVTFRMKVDAGGRIYDNPGTCRPEGPPAYVAALLQEAVDE